MVSKGAGRDVSHSVWLARPGLHGEQASGQSGDEVSSGPYWIPSAMSGVGKLFRAVWESLWGLYELLRLAWLFKFRFRGAYWQWRLHTAFGRGYPPKAELLRSGLTYARWMHRMRRL